MSNEWEQALDHMYSRIDSTARTIHSGYPHYSDPDTGEWTTSPNGDWTGGFWNGMLWLAYATTGEPRYRDLAHKYTLGLRDRASSNTIFRGFLFYYGAAIGYILVSDPTARDVALEGARGLAGQYNNAARAIPLGVEAEEASDVGEGEANIDGVPGGTPLLVWAAAELVDDHLAEIGINHALRHIEFCVRADGSVCQSASFDPDTGEIEKRYTHKGYSDQSTWTRAQAWAMLGYTTSSIMVPHDNRFLTTAMNVADWWLEHVPNDYIAYWDFDAPSGPDTPRDTSGTAIAAAALLKLSELAPKDDDRQRYLEGATASVSAMTSRYLTPITASDPRPPGILTEGCYNNRIGLATKHDLIWGDYFLFETLLGLEHQIKSVAI